MNQNKKEGDSDIQPETDPAQVPLNETAQKDKQRGFQNDLSQRVQEEKELGASQIFFREDAARRDEEQQGKKTAEIDVVDLVMGHISYIRKHRF